MCPVCRMLAVASSWHFITTSYEKFVNNRYVDVIRTKLSISAECVKIRNRNLKGVHKLCVC